MPCSPAIHALIHSFLCSVVPLFLPSLTHPFIAPLVRPLCPPQVGLGMPVFTIAGEGPQFSYAFAEAQQRLLGKSVSAVGGLIP